MNKIKPPYNVNQASQELTLQALEEVEQVNSMIKDIVQQREALHTILLTLPIVQKIYQSDANFLLVKFINARVIYDYLLEQGIVVRDRSRVTLCEGCLRITIGTPAENETLVESLKTYAASLA